jgi:HK97 family phage major capsid protein
MNPKDLKEKLQKALLDARAVADAAEKESRDFTDEERQKVKGLMDEAGNLKRQIKQTEDDEALRKQINELGAGIEFKSQGAGERGPGVPAGRGQTLGERFVESEQFKGWLKQVAPSGHIPESAKGLMSPPVEFASLFGRKTLITGESDISAGAFVQTDYTGIYEPLGRRPLVLRDVIANRTTTSDLVEFVRQTAKVTQAAPVAESNVTNYTGATGQVSGEKPEGASTWEKVTAAVKTIAVWIPATKRALSDAAQLRGIIDQELRADLEEDLEDELVGGDGTGEHFTGLLHTSGILTQAWNTDLLTTARKAITYLRVTGRARPTAWLVHPNDAEVIDLLKDGENRYYYGGPSEGGVQRLWRIPVVECEACTEGEAILGDFRKAVLWDRERASIQISDSHADFFIRNMVAVLAEMRAAFGVIRPSAFCTVALDSGT